jgi:hypothetical protein
MRPKYAKGDKVRIKARDLPERISDPNVRRYENMTGEVIESTNIVAFMAEPLSNLYGPAGRVTIYHYSVKLSDQIILHDVLEDFLEFSGTKN